MKRGDPCVYLLQMVMVYILALCHSPMDGMDKTSRHTPRLADCRLRGGDNRCPMTMPTSSTLTITHDATDVPPVNTYAVPDSDTRVGSRCGLRDAQS